MTKLYKENKLYIYKENKIYIYSEEMNSLVENWTTEIYLNILMFQDVKYRYVIKKLDDLERKNKFICQTYVMGLLKPELNNALLEKYSVDEYLTGISNLCKFYNMYAETDKDSMVIKKGWMNEIHRKKFFN